LRLVRLQGFVHRLALRRILAGLAQILSLEHAHFAGVGEDRHLVHRTPGGLGALNVLHERASVEASDDVQLGLVSHNVYRGGRGSDRSDEGEDRNSGSDDLFHGNRGDDG